MEANSQMPPARPVLSPDFLATAASASARQAPAAVPRLVGGVPQFGLSQFYAYDNHPDHGLKEITCGQAAIASLWDFWNVVPFPLPRTKLGADGRMHYPGAAMIEGILRHYGHTQMLGLRFTSGDTIVQAMRDRGLQSAAAYPGAFSNGAESANTLRNYIAQARLPVLCLIDLNDLNKIDKIWDSSAMTWYALHWAPVIGFSAAGVTLASWESIFHVSWPAFMAGWHCGGLPYPNNYYAIYTHRP